MDLNTMIVNPNDVLSSLPCYPQDQINMSYSPPEIDNKNLIHNFSFEIKKPLKIFRSSLDLLFEYLENDTDTQDENNHPNILYQNHYEKNINTNIENMTYVQKGLEQTQSYYENNVHDKLINESDFTNKCVFMNNNIDIDNNFCDNIIQGNEDQALKLMETYSIDPFKFNQTYQTNPIGLAYLNKHEKLIKIIKDLVYSEQIPYDYNFYCPNWSLKRQYPGFISYQKKIFESMYQSLVQAFWSDEMKEWIEF
jgi:hypothetical protein